MENIEYSNSLYQISEILKCTDPKLRARIPKKIISYFENNKAKECNWNINKALPLEKQELLPETKQILTLLYRDYICDDKERIKLEKVLNDNEIKYQNELREKYNPDNIFKDNKKISTQNYNKDLINHKKSLLSRIIDKFKLIFHK